MGGSAPAPPPPPDPVATAQAQTGENIGTSVANAALQDINQTDQFGDKSQYTVNGYTPMTIMGQTYNIPQYSQATTLGPQAQQLYNSTIGTEQAMANDAGTLATQAQSAISNPPQLSGVNLQQLGALPNADLSAGNINNFINTQWEQPFNNMASQQQEQLDQQLASQGIIMGGSGGGQGPGGAGGTGNAYQNAQYNLGQELQGQQDTYDTAMYGTAASNILGATQLEDQNLINQNQQNNQNTLNQAQFNNQEALTTQDQPINELSALLGETQVQQPSFANTPVSQNTIPTTDYAQIVQNSYQDELASYNAQVQANAANNGGLFGLGGSILGGLVKALPLGGI